MQLHRYDGISAFRMLEELVENKNGSKMKWKHSELFLEKF
jgi:hypothetical protein